MVASQRNVLSTWMLNLYMTLQKEKASHTVLNLYIASQKKKLSTSVISLSVALQKTNNSTWVSNLSVALEGIKILQRSGLVEEKSWHVYFQPDIPVSLQKISGSTWEFNLSVSLERSNHFSAQPRLWYNRREKISAQPRKGLQKLWCSTCG